MHHVHLIAGIAWNPGIRGILVVLTGFAVLCGSIYLLLATNIGARLGLLVGLRRPVRLAVDPDRHLVDPAAGHRPPGPEPVLDPVEVYVDDPATGPAKTEVVDSLPTPDELPNRGRHHRGATPSWPRTSPTPSHASLSDIAVVAPRASSPGRD